MNIPTANIRKVDRVRAVRAVLGFIRADSLALEDVLAETASDENGGGAAALILALVEAAATFASAAPDAEAQLQQILMDYASEEADRG